MIEFSLLSASAYVLGSINFAILVMKATGRGDPRSKFSGNAGATNVYRQAGLFWAAVVLLLDFGRALLLSFLSIHWSGITSTPWVGLFLLLGNRFPCFHQFKGGKGVASYIGFTAALSPLTAALSCLVWVAGYSVFRVPFIASLGMIIILSVGSYDRRFVGYHSGHRHRDSPQCFSSPTTGPTSKITLGRSDHATFNRHSNNPCLKKRFRTLQAGSFSASC